MVTMGARPGLRLSRVTLVGRRRRVDLVLPSDEPVGRFLPQVLELLADEPENPPMSRYLVTAAGTVLPQDGSLSSAGVPDGAVLRLVRAQYAPAAPVVHDVTDEVADDLGLRPWTWSPRARRWTVGALAVVLALTACALAWRSVGPAALVPWSAMAAVLASAAGVAAARLRGGGSGDQALGVTLLSIGGALGLLAVGALSSANGLPAGAAWAGWGAVGVVVLTLLGVLTPVGRAGLIGAGALLTAAAVWVTTAALVRGGTPAEADSRLGAVVGVVSVIALGLLPRFALSTAGLTSLDDRRAGGVSVSRYQVKTALAAAHRGLALATVVTAVSAVAAGWLTADVADWWSAALCLALSLVLSSRARAFPLTVEAIVLHLAALVVLVRVMLMWLAQETGSVWPVAPLCAVALALLGMLAVQPQEHIRARLRRVTDLVEAAGVIALFPLLVGLFGMYGRLLGAF